MTWIGMRVINVDTMVTGKIATDDNMNVTRVLGCKMEDGSEEIISMNNTCHLGREFEIDTQEKYKHMFWEHDDKWLPFADVDFVKDPKQLWENCAKLDPTVRECSGYKQAMEQLQ